MSWLDAYLQGQTGPAGPAGPSGTPPTAGNGITYTPGSPGSYSVTPDPGGSIAVSSFGVKVAGTPVIAGLSFQAGLVTEVYVPTQAVNNGSGSVVLATIATQPNKAQAVALNVFGYMYLATPGITVPLKYFANFYVGNPSSGGQTATSFTADPSLPAHALLVQTNPFSLSASGTNILVSAAPFSAPAWVTSTTYYGSVSAVPTAVVSGASIGATLPQATIDVASATGLWPNVGVFYDAAQSATVSYTGFTGTSAAPGAFTGCTTNSTATLGADTLNAIAPALGDGNNSIVSHVGNLYVCISPGLDNGSGPTGTGPLPVTSGSATWLCVGSAAAGVTMELAVAVQQFSA